MRNDLPEKLLGKLGQVCVHIRQENLPLLIKTFK